MARKTQENVEAQAPEAPVQDTQEAPEGAVQDTQEGAVQEAHDEAPALGSDALAEALGVSAKDARRWLRTQARDALGKAQADAILPGKGGRYAFTQAHVEALAAAYARGKARRGTTAPASAILAALAPEAPVE